MIETQSGSLRYFRDEYEASISMIKHPTEKRE